MLRLLQQRKTKRTKQSVVAPTFLNTKHATAATNTPKAAAILAISETVSREGKGGSGLTLSKARI